VQIDRRCLAEAMLANGPGTRRQFQQPRQTLMQALFRTGIECARQMHCTINGVAHVMVATALVDSLSAAILFHNEGIFILKRKGRLASWP
jgi:hypothetical protein